MLCWRILKVKNARPSSHYYRCLCPEVTPRPGELKLPEKRVEQLCVDEKDIADKLFGEAGDRNSSKDVYGWASWLFFPWRGETGGFFTSLVRFVRLLINRSDLFPPMCAVLLGTGSLPLAQAQQRRTAAVCR